MAATTKYAIPYPIASDAPAGHTQMQALAAQVDAKMAGYLSGTIGSRPAAATAGLIYRATDTGLYYVDTGSTWVELGLADSRGKSIITAEESRTNTAYGPLGTPDQVQNVGLPTDGLFVIGYFALWKCSVANAASASLFLGGNQAQISLTGTPIPQEVTHQAGSANRYTALTTTAQGLSTTQSGSSATGSVATTGQIIATTGATLSGTNFDGGGFTVIWAAAGTYTVSVQFRASSGSVTVKERRLWVRALAY
jgi:hypothetical protein